MTRITRWTRAVGCAVGLTAACAEVSMAAGVDTHDSLDAGAQALVDRYIANQESFDNGTEYLDARESYITDINQDGSAEVMALYTLEGAGGGNSSYRNMVIFRFNGSHYEPAADIVLQGGGSLDHIEKGMIYIQHLYYQDDDPRCCPSGKTMSRYVYDGVNLAKML